MSTGGNRMPKGVAGSLRDRRLKLEAELRAIRTAEEKERSTKDALAGRAVLARAETDPAFKQTLTAILEATITKPKERKLLGLSNGRGDAVPHG